MSAYVISEVAFVDHELALRYRELAATSIEAYGGVYRVRGATPEAVEGEIEENRRLVVVEFPSMATAKKWYASAEYAEALELRAEALDRRLLFVEGV